MTPRPAHLAPAQARRSIAPRLPRLVAVPAVIAALLAVALLGSAEPATAGGPVPEPPSVDAKAWILIDARSGERIAGSRARRELPIASATKLMTAELAFTELRLGRRLRAPAYNASAAESRINLREGERMSVRDLLYALMLESANDAAVTIANGAAGSVRAFVDQMNERARELGLDETSYANPIGLDDPDNHSSARDLAALARRLRAREAFAKIVDTDQHTLNTGAKPRTVESRNRLLRRAPWIDGVKTGHTRGAGYVLVGSGERKGVELISVVLGAPSEAARDAETLELLGYGFSLFRLQTVAARGAQVADVGLELRDEQLGLVPARVLRVTARAGQRVERAVEAPAEVSGPIERGERLGTLAATVDGEEAGSVPLVAIRAADGPSIVDRARANAAAIVALSLAGLIVIGMGFEFFRRRRAYSRRLRQRRDSHRHA